MKKYVIALDQGTTSSRAVIFDKCSKLLHKAQYPFKQYFPEPGWVEHDPNEILETQFRALRDVVSSSGILPSEIAAIGITNQRETVIAWDKVTGEPAYNAIVWQCRRTADICEEIKSQGHEEYIKQVTGLPIDPYFSGTKCKWLIDNVPKVRELKENGRLAFGTIDSWLIWSLTDGKLHITDVTNASRTMLFDINRLCYDQKLCDILGVPIESLPTVVPSGKVYGEINTAKHLLGEFAGIPICSALGDQQAALFGQKCFNVGDIKNTYGTGCFTLMNIGDDSSVRTNDLITTVGWQYGEETVWALEGSVFNAGSSVQWLRDQLGIISTAAECSELAETVEDNGGVYLVSAFNGLGTPYWDMYARGSIFGITRGTTKAHIARATLEGIAYQVYDLIKTMEKVSSKRVTSLKADGGASVSRFLMQFQSDILNTKVICPESAEITAFGAALMAGITCGFYNKDELESGEIKKIYTPKLSQDEIDKLIHGWQKAVKRTLNWENE